MGSSQTGNFPGQPQTLSPGLAAAPGPSPAFPVPVPGHPISERLWLDLPPVGEAQWELGSSQVVKSHVQPLLKAHSWSPRAGQGCCCAQQSWCPGSLCLGCSMTWPRGHRESLGPGTFGHLSRPEGLRQSRARGATWCHSVHVVPQCPCGATQLCGGPQGVKQCHGGTAMRTCVGL